jgi:hypothetical protein
MTISIFGWEVNTHRAIDRKAIEQSVNLKELLVPQLQLWNAYQYLNSP